jgi:hypothetical protein
MAAEPGNLVAVMAEGSGDDMPKFVSEKPMGY